MFCSHELEEDDDRGTCKYCLEKLPFIVRPCERCGGDRLDSNTGVCFNCKKRNHEFVRAVSVMSYTDKVPKVLHKFKYLGREHYGKHLAKFMAQAFALSGIEVDIVTEVPMYPIREEKRGYNQATILAKEVGEFLGIKYLPLCEKTVDNLSQASLDFKKRQENVKDVYKFDKAYRKEIKGKSVLVVDDIFTTGATTDEISKVLKSAGASAVYVLTFAHSLGEIKDKIK